MRRAGSLLAMLLAAAGTTGAQVSVPIATTETGEAEILGPTVYLRAADSPFAGTGFSWFHLEDFEDHDLDAPGVSVSAGATSSASGFSGTIVDSVDADDGRIDGHCVPCESWYANPGATGIRFTFDAGALGSLPTHAGIVWTDGANYGGTITFEAFGPGGESLGSVSATPADLCSTCGAGDDRFFGVHSAGGIESIWIRNQTGGIEVDHLQYGFSPPDALASLTLAQPLIAGCLKTTGKVKLAAPAPVGGLTVALHSDNPKVVVPASVTFKAGVLAKSFPILTSPVVVRETATIQASVPAEALSATLTIKPIGPKAVALLPNPVVGGNPVAATVTLQCPAGPGPIVVFLGSSNTAVAVPTMASLTVPGGTKTMPFDVATAVVDRVRKPTITATANGVKRGKTLTVNPAP